MSRDIPVDDKYYTRLAEQYRKAGQDDEVNRLCEKICPEGRADLYFYYVSNHSQKATTHGHKDALLLPPCGDWHQSHPE